MSKEKEKVKNINKMLKQFGKFYMNMPDSQLRKDFLRFLNMIRSGTNLEKIITKLEHNIERAVKVLSKDSNSSTKTIVTFWKSIEEIVVDTYKTNREIDRRR